MDAHQAKDLVQDVLFNFWVKRTNITIETKLKAYLSRAVVNRSIDQIRRKKRFGVPEEITDFSQASKEASAQEVLENVDLNQTILSAIESLPERCKLIFSLSRFEDLLPAYHRLDIGLYFQWTDKKTFQYLHLGVSNLYNRKNPYYQYLRQDEDFPEENGLKQQNALPILPSLSYRLVW